MSHSPRLPKSKAHIDSGAWGGPHTQICEKWFMKAENKAFSSQGHVCFSSPCPVDVSFLQLQTSAGYAIAAATALSSRFCFSDPETYGQRLGGSHYWSTKIKLYRIGHTCKIRLCMMCRYDPKLQKHTNTEVLPYRFHSLSTRFLICLPLHQQKATLSLVPRTRLSPQQVLSCDKKSLEA